MKTASQKMENVGFEKINVASTAKGGCPQQQPGSMTAFSSSSSPRPVETMTDSQSYGLMEERYGIQEEGIF
jgi:hypothetical protein